MDKCGRCHGSNEHNLITFGWWFLEFELFRNADQFKLGAKFQPRWTILTALLIQYRNFVHKRGTCHLLVRC